MSSGSGQSSVDTVHGNFRIDHLPPYQLGSVARHVNELRLAGKDVIDFSQLNPDLPPPQPALDKLVQGILLPHNHRYSSSQGIAKLREAGVEFYQRKFGVTLDVDAQIAGTLGTKEALSHLLLAVLSPGEHVILPTPCYPIHRSGVFLAGGSSVGVSLFSSWEDGAQSGFQLRGESEGFFQRLSIACQSSWPKPRALILNFPHNPTGATADLSFFERLVAFAREQKLILVHDFAYLEMNFEHDGKVVQPPSILQVPGATECAVEFFSFSKLFCLPGWRVGFCAGNPELVAALKKIKSYLDFGAFQPIQIAAAFLLNRNDLGLEENRAKYQVRASTLVGGLRDLGFDVHSPTGGMIVWARIPEQHRRLGSIAFSHKLLEQALTAVSPGAGFDPSADDCVRFSLGENESRIRKACERLRLCL